MSEPPLHYRAYGLNWRSEIDLGWPATFDRRSPDVDIRLGTVPRVLDERTDAGGYWQARPGAYLLSVEGAGRFLVSGYGGSVRVEPDPAAEVEDVSTYLLGSVLGACLQMRGVLTLHAAAIETAGGAVLLAGRSGIGKSTLLAALTDLGYAMLADDVTGVVSRGDGEALALSAFPLTRLWPAALDRLPDSWRAGALGPLRQGVDKLVVPVRRFCDRPLAVRAVYLLSTHNRAEVAFVPRNPGEAFTGLVRNTYRPRALRGLGLQDGHFRAVASVVRSATVERLARPHHGCPPEAVAAILRGRLPPPA